MKKWFTGFLCLVLILALAACKEQVGQADNASTSTVQAAPKGVTMQAEKDTYPADVAQIKVTWQNQTDRELTFGEAYQIEKKVDGEWQRQFSEKEAGFNAIGLPVMPHSQRTHTYDIRTYANVLDAGTYRIATQFSDVNKPGDYVTYVLYAEFNV